MIQVDMFEVQLGASVLLQFKSPEGRVVRVLADAGHRMPTGDVHLKLTNAFEAFGCNERRIDLLMGTHYDADHLDGFVPIIKDRKILVGEAWLPPVANDTERHAFDESLSDRHLLPNQFYSVAGRQVLLRYLNAKRHVCESLKPVVGEGKEESGSADELNEENMLWLAPLLFRKHRDEAIKSLRYRHEAYSHADDEHCLPPDRKDFLRAIGWNDSWKSWFGYRQWPFDDDPEKAMSFLKAAPEGSIAAYNSAQIRKSAACDAINAVSLAEVVEALRERKVPMVCQMIPDGTPRRFVWRSLSPTTGRFEGGAQLAAHGPEVTLLGPSESLVKKHWNRLPIGTYAAVAMLSHIPLKSITPSNQLSYVARFGCEGQGILISGDAGCVDFVPKPNAPYYPTLLGALLPLHVVQVAHHAGNNAQFYRVLTAAKYPDNVGHSYLLVSHATEDIYRPSREFRQFVQDVRREPDVAKILFTTQPRIEKVREFYALVHRPVGPIAREGDVRIEFRDGEWAVTKHAVAI